MQALYMADWQTFCDVYSLSKKNFFLSLKVCNYDSSVMKNAVGFYFFVLYLVLFFFLIKSTTLLWKALDGDMNLNVILVENWIFLIF